LRFSFARFSLIAVFFPFHDRTKSRAGETGGLRNFRSLGTSWTAIPSKHEHRVLGNVLQTFVELFQGNVHSAGKGFLCKLLPRIDVEKHEFGALGLQRFELLRRGFFRYNGDLILIDGETRLLGKGRYSP